MSDASHTLPLILLVDDVPANLHILTVALRKEYRLKTATSGVQALALAADADRPQLILLDVMMPGMNGIEVLERLRAVEETRDIPVIFVSADTSEQSQLTGLNLGADDYLTKPVVLPILKARVRNLLQRKQAEAQLRLAAHVFEHSGEAMLITDHDNCILEVNPAFTRLTGYTADEVRGQNPSLLASGRTSATEYESLWQSIERTGFWQGEIWDRHKDGGVYPKLMTVSVVRNIHGRIDFHIASFTDISEQKAVEERIRHVAHHDPLTGLPNRLHLQIALEQLLRQARQEERELAIMFIDLDRFKIINDTLGHSIGDALLVEVAGRLRHCVRDNDLIARLGGDEFVIVLSEHRVVTHATHVADTILHSIGQTFLINGQELHTTPSIGISLFPGDGDDLETLMKCADTAMYHAKSLGRNNAQFFSPEINPCSAEQMQLEHQLHLAIERGELILHYQPQVDPATGGILGVEALVRWMHPEHGLIPPNKFIAIAEETGIILRLGDWVLETACAQLRAWRTAGIQGLRMAVNLSPHQLRQPQLAQRVAQILHQNDLAGPDLELEITESTAMQNPEATIKLLGQLRAIGVELAIDDFGTGYSSLSHLKLLPIHRLKLDRSFVKDIETDPNDATICSATIALAHALGLQVVAEGVETEAQHNYLKELGCNVMQGFLFSKPVDASILSEEWLNMPRPTCDPSV